MALALGTRLGVYEVTAQIGEGGMGAVYRATDTSLGRQVAIKVLPDAFAQDAERLARFEREAKTLASLNHPNIAAIYGFEKSAGTHALVMELVEGEDLSQRIARGAIPVEEALPIAKQVAEALEAAHEQGIIHRDLKPANIKVREDGTVKVLDFGLAKAMEPTGAMSPSLSMSPTITTPAMTQAGMILGTAAYMSPEQARGKAADKRSDLWALGCVMYEMLTGRRAFEGGEVSDTLASVLKSEPDWTRLPADTPIPARRLLARCLEKDRRRRLDSAVAARLEIDEALTAPERGAAAALRAAHAAAMPAQAKLAWMVALAAVVTAGVLAIPAMRYVREVPPEEASEIRLAINTPPTIDPVSLAISPDGQTLVFAATTEGRSQLWLRSLDAVSARPLAGTDGGSLPFWSPNNRSIGFFADGKLKRIEINGGVVQTLADAALGRGGAWNRDDLIIFAPHGVTPILRMPAAGGTPVATTRLETPRQATHASPRFLPDGRHFLYYVTGSPDARGVYVGQLDGTGTRRLLDADGTAVYRSPGSLLFVNQGTLFAQRFDPVRLALTGNASALAQHTAVNGALIAALSTSTAGPIVYRTGSGIIKRQFVWVDRLGKEIGTVGEPDSANPGAPSMSSDGRRVALHRVVNGKQDIWVLDVERGVLSRFTSDATTGNFPIWSPDGSRIVFGSNRKGAIDLYGKPATGAEREKLLLETPQLKVALDWSSDGRFLLFRSLDPKTSYDIWALPLEGDRKPFPVVRTDFDERDGQFSPDGHWVAYQSNESGRFEIYVQPFRGPGGKPGGRERISTNGGAQVRWRRDGKEMYYMALDGRLMAVPVRLTSNGQAVEVGSPVPLFATHVGGALQGIGTQQYMVSHDGQRFLVNTVTEDTPSPITVILNWKPKP